MSTQQEITDDDLYQFCSSRTGCLQKGYVVLLIRNVMAVIIVMGRALWLYYIVFCFVLYYYYYFFFYFFHYETRTGAWSLCEYYIAKRDYVLHIIIIIIMSYRVKATAANAFAPDGQWNSMRRSRCVITIITTMTIIIIITC